MVQLDQRKAFTPASHIKWDEVTTSLASMKAETFWAGEADVLIVVVQCTSDTGTRRLGTPQQLQVKWNQVRHSPRLHLILVRRQDISQYYGPMFRDRPVMDLLRDGDFKKSTGNPS